MKHTLDAQLGAASRAGLLEKILDAQRRKLFDAFLRFKQGNDSDSILDVEAGSALQQQASYLVAWSDARQRTRITSCAIEPALGGFGRHGGDAPKATFDDRLKYRRADGRLLPFADGEFDWVFCADIIEHAGGAEQQVELLRELNRVARKGVFVTASNRWHPFEFHTALPLLHWLPAPVWRGLLKLCGKGQWASQAALNLLDAPGLHGLAARLPGKPHGEVGHIRLGGIKAHFFLQIRKVAVPGQQKAA